MKCQVSLAAVLAAFVFVPASQAVTNIRYERWETRRNLGRDTVAPIDTTSLLSFSFDANVTAADLAGGFRFALAEKDARARDVLMQFTLAGPCTQSPPLGADVLIQIYCSLYCDAGGKLRASDVARWAVTWCDVPLQEACGTIGIAATVQSSSDSEDFELILLDEDGQDGSFPTPENGLSCGDGAPSGPELVAVAPEFAASGSIGIYADPSGLLCSDQVKLLVPFRWYVVARLEGMTRCGITVVDLGIHGLPPDFFISITPNPAANAVIGNPLTSGALGFDCERGDGEAIVLYTLDGIATNAVENVEMVVDAGSPPSNRHWPYPWNDLCPISGSGRRRMRGTTFVINPPPGHPCDTTVHAEPATWGAVKGLYRGEP